MIRRGSVLLSVALGWLSTSALAQTTTIPPQVDLERLELDTSALGSLLVGSGRTLEQGQFRVGLGIQYERDPLLVESGGQIAGAVVGNRVTAHVIAAVGVFQHLELGAQVPVIAFQNGDDLSSQGLSAVSSAGLETPWVSARYGILGAEDSSWALALQVGVGLPVGTASALGNSPVAFAPRVMASHTFNDFLFSPSSRG